MPESVGSGGGDALLRRYLARGGKVVWLGWPPLIAPLERWWLSAWAADPATVTTVLATDELGLRRRAAATVCRWSAEPRDHPERRGISSAHEVNRADAGFAGRSGSRRPTAYRSSKETGIVANPFVEFELNTTDVAAAQAFYSQLFDWRFENDSTGWEPYVEIDTGGEAAGGIVKNPVPGDPSAWIPYVAVDDVANSTQKARSLGARIWKGATELPGHGTYSIIADPTGAVLGLWRSSED